ncbi:hypothetical protein ACOMHN_057449 [Nucella lapillus]
MVLHGVWCLSVTWSVVVFQGFQLETLPPSQLQLEREAFKGLILPVNRGWEASFESFDIVFPYKYNFAACYEEALNTVKWLKLVHKVKKKPFTVHSPLPADLRIKIKMLSIEVCDDPFEVKVGLNYELLKDEVQESKKRREVMDAKLVQLSKAQNISVAKREELYASLHKKSAEIYIQRSRQMYSNGALRSQLFTWLMQDLEVLALADPSLHGRDNAILAMTRIDKDSPPPTPDMSFVTLWCRGVKAGVAQWSLSLRDFPQPMVDVAGLHVWGTLVGAERDGTRRAKRECVVEVEAPWGDMEIQRNLPALKFFHDFSSDVASVTLAYGVCWEPAVAMHTLAVDLVTQPSVDPSRPLPFWDKARLLLHGRLTAALAKMSWLYHASLDPHNNTELMDWTWAPLLLDWTNGQFVLKGDLDIGDDDNDNDDDDPLSPGQFVLKGDLDISVRTASKYNESKLFHFPNLKFCVGLQWLCLGDPNDHHPVMPCAPDKVPDFSHEEHDSFRAFRSQNLNLDLSLKTKPSPQQPDRCPSSPEFYASSLRFLDKIRQCMFSVTRPVRRGKLFGVVTPRKPQLTRHYRYWGWVVDRKIRLTVDFRRFVLCHWMSNAKQHGRKIRLTVDFHRFVLCHWMSNAKQHGMWKIRLTVDFHRFVLCHWMSNAKQHGMWKIRLTVDFHRFVLCHWMSNAKQHGMWCVMRCAVCDAVWCGVCRKIRLTVDFHRFVLCHWMSNAKQHGAELAADSLQLAACQRLNLLPLTDGLLHRPRAVWTIRYLAGHLGPTHIYLCQEARPKEGSASGGAPVDKSFFLSVSKISYHRAESRHPTPGQEVGPEQAPRHSVSIMEMRGAWTERNRAAPRHSVSIMEMRGAWTERNRAVLLGLYDSYRKAQALRRNLSSEALKGFRVDTPPSMRSRSFSLSSGPGESTPGPLSPSPLSKLQSGHAHSMLLKLVSESDSKSVAFTEEPSNSNMELLHGVKACRPTNILSTNWLIELHNSQVVMKGSEGGFILISDSGGGGGGDSDVELHNSQVLMKGSEGGFILISAARARVVSYLHTPIWHAATLRSKSTWTAHVDCMQYYATVDPDVVVGEDTIPWLSRENVEDRSGSGLTGLPEMVGSGQTVGSVVSSTLPASCQQRSAAGELTVQLQRIIHRCSCKFYYANYGDVDPNTLSEVPLPPAEDSDVMTQEEGVDTLTMLHESLHAYSNSSQYTVIMDIVNNLLLYVEPKKKEASEKLQSMRFKLQLSRDEDQKTPILQLQEVVRERVQDLRKLERDFYVAKMSGDEEL